MPAKNSTAIAYIHTYTAPPSSKKCKTTNSSGTENIPLLPRKRLRRDQSINDEEVTTDKKPE